MPGTHKMEIWDISNLTQALGHALIFDHFHMDENFNNFFLEYLIDVNIVLSGAQSTELLRKITFE